MKITALLTPLAVMALSVFGVNEAVAQASFSGNYVTGGSSGSLTGFYQYISGTAYSSSIILRPSYGVAGSGIVLTSGQVPASVPATVPALELNTLDATGTSTNLLKVLRNGQMRIGLQAPSTAHSDYKLAVDGKLVAKSIYVTAPSTWADFVFEPSYTYMQLPALENYLATNKHLPNMPSAAEVETNGYNLNEMDAKLLQNVEEITLRLIELSKQNEALQAKVADLQAQVANR